MEVRNTRILYYAAQSLCLSACQPKLLHTACKRIQSTTLHDLRPKHSTDRKCQNSLSWLCMQLNPHQVGKKHHKFVDITNTYILRHEPCFIRITIYGIIDSSISASCKVTVVGLLNQFEYKLNSANNFYFVFSGSALSYIRLKVSVNWRF